MSAPPHKTWPRSYLLSIYDAAITNGFIWVKDLSRLDSQSLRMSIYRLRRRSDTSNRSIIIPEYHLVTCGEWVSYDMFDDYGLGRMPVVFSALPDGTALPALSTRDDEPISLVTHQRLPAAEAFPPVPAQADAGVAISDPQPLTHADLQLDPEAIGSYVERLVAAARAKEQKE